MHFCNS